MGREASIRLNITVSSGTGTGTITNTWEKVNWLRVVPIAESDTFDVTIKDGDGYIMLKRTGQTGTFSEQVEMSLGIMKTILIENAAQDGTFVCKFDFH